MGGANWESELLEAIETHADEVLELSAEVARTAAVDATEVARFAARYLERCGLFPFTHDAGAGRLNVLARYDGDPGSAGRHLVLCGYSRVGSGGPDAARLAGALWATGLVARLGAPLAGPLSILVVGGDREGEYGVPWVLDRDLIERPSAALIAGPSDPVYPGIGQLGRCQFEVHVTDSERDDSVSDAREASVGGGVGEYSPSGRRSERDDSVSDAREASVGGGVGEYSPSGRRSEQNDSVIVHAATAVLALRQIAELRADVPRDIVDIVDRSRRVMVAGNGAAHHTRFDHVNANIGTIHGGSAIDAVAQRCVIGVDCSLPFGVDRGRVLGQARKVLGDCGVRGEIAECGSGAPASLTSTSEPIVRSVLGAVRDVVDARAHGVLHLSAGDARWFREHGIPAVQYGPGDRGTPRAAVRPDLPGTVDAATVYALTMLRYLRVSGRGHCSGAAMA